jgi:hypothetical protein
MTLLLIVATHARIAVFNSASEMKRWLRSFANTKRSTICTATSTLALSRGLMIRVGSTTQP